MTNLGAANQGKLGRRAVLTALSALIYSPPAMATPPRRVACFDWALSETMIALGAQPIAVVGAADWPRFVVEPPLPPGTADLGLQQEVNFELLARLRPDLALVSPFLERLVPQIERIAPTMSLSVFEDNGAPLALREEITRKLGARLGLDAEADAFLAATRIELDGLRDRVARLPQRSILVATFVDARHVRVYGGSSLFQNVLVRLGLENAWRRPVGYFGFEMVGIERLATSDDLQLVVLDPIPPDLMPRLASSPLWTELPFVHAGHITTLPPVLMFGAMPAACRFARLLVAALEGFAR